MMSFFVVRRVSMKFKMNNREWKIKEVEQKKF